MKAHKLVLAALMFLGLSQVTEAQNTFGLPEDPNTKKITYVEVVQMPGVSKDMLYERGLKGVKSVYKAADKLIKVNDKANGEILMNCSTAVLLKDKKSGNMTQEGYILYKLKLSFKEGKYRYEFFDIHKDQGGFKVTLEKWLEPGQYNPSKDRMEERMAFLDADIKKNIEGLKEAMKGTKAQVKEDW